MDEQRTTNDLIDALRYSDPASDEDCSEAADRLESQQAKIERLEGLMAGHIAFLRCDICGRMMQEDQIQMRADVASCDNCTQQHAAESAREDQSDE